jgi:hypothetical protein
MVMSPAGLEPENDCAGEGQQHLLMTDPSSHQRGCYIRTINASVELQNKKSGRGSEGACRQDEVIVGRLPALK